MIEVLFDDFIKINNGEELFKIAAANRLQSDNISGKDKLEEISLKYQIASTYTSFVGVIKNEQKSNKEIIHIKGGIH